MILCDGTGVLIGLIRAPREPVGFGANVTPLRLRWHANPESAGNRPAVHRRSADDHSLLRCPIRLPHGTSAARAIPLVAHRAAAAEPSNGENLLIRLCAIAGPERAYARRGRPAQS